MFRAEELILAVNALTQATRAVEKILTQTAASDRAVPNLEILTAREAANLLGCEVRTLKTYREEWSEGIHYWRQAKGYKYNRLLLEDWIKNRFNPTEHQAAIEQWARKKK